MKERGGGVVERIEVLMLPSSLFAGIVTRHTVSILLLAFGVSILILPQGNVTCYLEGVVMGRHKFRVSLNFVSSVSVVRSYL